MRDIYFLMTIDTECDKSNDWSTRYPFSFKNILEAIPGRLQPLFNKYRSQPTYLISPEVMKNPDCIKVFKNLQGVYELGTHLHGEYIEPHSNYASKTTSDYQVDYSYEVEYDKMYNLTNLFESSFGFRPLSFRAGRFGIGPSTLRILNKLNYKTDSSIYPQKIIRTKNYKLNHYGYPLKPYFPDLKRTLRTARPGNETILEVPITVQARLFQLLPAFIGRAFAPSVLFMRLAQILFGKNLIETHSLRPSRTSEQDLIDIINSYLSLHSYNEPVFLNMMFHSNEIYPGSSPYAENNDEVTAWLGRLEHVLIFLGQIAARSITLQDSYSILKSRDEAH